MKNKGIYLIQNTLNGKEYVGSSSNIRKKLQDHRSQLIKNKHFNRYLQYSVNKYGIECFTFQPLEYIEDENLLTIKENEWIDRLKTTEKDFGYNMTLPSMEYGLTGGTSKLQEETKELIRRVMYTNRVGYLDEETYNKWKENVYHKPPDWEPKDYSLLVFNKDTGEQLFEFNNPEEASITLNINRKKIIAVLTKEITNSKTGKIMRSYKGYIFVYKRDIEEGKVYKLSDYHIQRRIIEVRDKEDNLIGEFVNGRQASEILGIKLGTIGDALAHLGRLTQGKYYFKYRDNDRIK